METESHSAHGQNLGIDHKSRPKGSNRDTNWIAPPRSLGYKGAGQVTCLANAGIAFRYCVNRPSPYLAHGMFFCLGILSYVMPAMVLC